MNFKEEHFMTDYGDENTRTDPWSLFDREDASEALDMAEKCFALAGEIFKSTLTKLENEVRKLSTEPKINSPEPSD